MEKIVCEMCGSHDIQKQDGLYVCQHCGTKYSVEEAKKLVVKIDNSDEIANLFIIARRAKAEKNYGEARKHYAQIMAKDPNNWEAVFNNAYCKAMDTTIGNIKYATKDMENHLDTLYNVLKNLSDDEIQRAIPSICREILIMGEFFRIVSRDQYKKFATSTYDQHAQQHIDEIKEIGVFYSGYGMFLGDIDKKRGSKNTDRIVELLKKSIDCFAEVSPLTMDGLQNVANSVGDIIREYQPSYSTPTLQKKSAFFGTTSAASSSNGSSGCYVATCIYGSYDCPEVWVLRRYRDNTLSNSIFGRTFIKLYYAISPTLVLMFGKQVWFHKFWRPKLDSMVNRLKEKGISDTQYYD